MIEFKGREKELGRLREKNWRNKAELIALYGRRRVGKTALVEKAFEKNRVWKFEGIEGASPQKQIEHFLLTLSDYSQDERVPQALRLRNWREALLALNAKLAGKPIVVFFDEFQWMAGMRSPLVSVFKWAWDNHFSKHKACRFVLCGSVSSFIVNNVIKSKALYGRVDLEMNLQPFSVYETAQFFEGKRAPQEVLDIYLTFGGIPQYLMELNPKHSLMQNLNELAFSPNGYFFREYQRLFISHFARNNLYARILKLLSLKKSGVETESLAQSLKLSTGGTLSRLLEDLELAGFIERYVPLDKNADSRLVRNRIDDEFLDFYFTFIDKNRASIQAGRVQAHDVFAGSRFEQWRGYAFEQLCRKNASFIAHALGFSGIRYRAGAWFRSDEKVKTQADLVFDRADSVLTVCEIKYTDKFDVASIMSRFERRVSVLKHYYPRHSIQKVLIVGKPVPLPSKLRGYFDEVLSADRIFFQKA